MPAGWIPHPPDIIPRATNQESQMAKKAAAKPKKTPAKKKTAKAPAKARKERMASQTINKEDQALFLQHLPLIAAQVGKFNKAKADLARLYKTAKADGFIKEDFDIAFGLQGESGEALQKQKIARRVTIARYLGLQLGDTLDLFLDQGVDEQPPEKRAFDAGKQDALENKKADATGFDEQEYLKGYHSVSEKRVKAGIKPTKPVSPAVKAAADRAAAAAEKKKAQAQEKSPEQEKAAQQRAQDAQAFEKPTSGVHLTRSQFQAQQRLAEDNAEVEGPPDTEPESSLFRRREGASVN